MNRIQKLLILCCAIIIIFSVSVTDCGNIENPLTKDMLLTDTKDIDEEASEYWGPKFSEISFEGNTIGKEYIQTHSLTLVLFWSSWCPHCINELDIFDGLCNKYSESNIGFLGVHCDEETHDEAKAIVEESNLSYPNIICGGDLAGIVNTQEKWPFIVFFDSDGETLYTIIGEKSIDYLSGVINYMIDTNVF